MLPTEDGVDPSALGEPERALRIWFDVDKKQFEKEERLVRTLPPGNSSCGALHPSSTEDVNRYPWQVRVGTSVAIDGRRRGLVLMTDEGDHDLMYVVKRFKTDHDLDEELMDETKVDTPDPTPKTSSHPFCKRRRPSATLGQVGALATWYADKYNDMSERPPGAYRPR